MVELFRELFIENYSKNKIDFIPRHFLINPLYPECNIDVDGELIEDESEYSNYIQCSYDYLENNVCDNYGDIENIMNLEDLINVIDDTFSYLNEREETVIRMRFGLNDEKSEYDLEEIGKTLKISRERVRQIESSAIKKLKHPKVSRVLKSYHDTYNDEGRFDRTFIYTKDTVHNRFMFIADYIADNFIVKNNKDLVGYEYTYSYRVKNNLIIIPNSKIELFKETFSKMLVTQCDNLKYVEIDSNLHNNTIYKALRSIGVYHNYFIPEDMKIKINLKLSLITVEIKIKNENYILYSNGKLEKNYY